MIVPAHGRASLLLAVACMAVLPAQSQQDATQPKPSPDASQAAPQENPPVKGKVLFERHEAASPDEQPSPDTDPVQALGNRPSHRQGLQRRDAAPATDGAASAPAQTEIPGANADGFSSSNGPVPAMATVESDKAALSIPDSERTATRVVSSDLDVHLDQHTGVIAVRARLVMRNAGTLPLARLPLQISSALHWQSASQRRNTGVSRPLPYEEHRLTTDADHTGAASEIGVTLPSPLAAAGEVSLELFYSGTLQQSADRLLRLGAPAVRAAQSDWDTVTDTFTGLRGFGNVLWFPVSAAPTFLADGANFASAVSAQRAVASTMSLRLTVETAGTGSTVAFFAGQPSPLTATNAPQSSSSADTEQTTIQTAEWKAISTGTHPVSLFLTADAVPAPEGGMELLTGNAAAAASYRAAADRICPLLTDWLGTHAAAPLTVLDLPVPNGQAFADGSLLVLPVVAASPKLLAPALVYPLAAAWLPASAPPWLRDGLPEFMRLLYLEQTEGRDSLLANLNSGAAPLARQESFRTASSPALDRCADPVCARNKAAYVFTMLRQIAGDQALQQALTGLLAKPASGMSTERFRELLTATSGKDLRWFFQDWIETDAGLPELSIVSVAPRRVERSTRTDYLPQQKRPVAGPIGAEPVAQAGDPVQADTATEASRNRVAPADGSWLVAVAVQNNGDAAAEVPVTVRAAGLQSTLPLRIAAHSRATVRVPFEAVPEEVWVNDGSTPETHSMTHHKSIDIPAEAR